MARPIAMALSAETLAAAGAASGQYFAAILGGHAGPKAVGTFAF